MKLKVKVNCFYAICSSLLTDRVSFFILIHSRVVTRYIKIAFFHFSRISSNEECQTSTFNRFWHSPVENIRERYYGGMNTVCECIIIVNYLYKKSIKGHCKALSFKIQFIHNLQVLMELESIEEIPAHPFHLSIVLSKKFNDWHQSDTFHLL